MRNAKDELLAEISSAKIVCAKIDYEGTIIMLSSSDDEAAYQKFLEDLDFRYKSGYGSQNLFGYVILDDNTWLERDSYDGSEWWELRKKPEVF